MSVPSNRFLKYKLYRKPTHHRHNYTCKFAPSIFTKIFKILHHLMLWYIKLLNVPLNHKDFQSKINTFKFVAVKKEYKRGMVDKLVHKYNNRQNKKVLNRQNKYNFISAIYTNLLPNTCLLYTSRYIFSYT